MAGSLHTTLVARFCSSSVQKPLESSSTSTLGSSSGERKWMHGELSMRQCVLNDRGKHRSVNPLMMEVYDDAVRRVLVTKQWLAKQTCVFNDRCKDRLCPRSTDGGRFGHLQADLSAQTLVQLSHSPHLPVWIRLHPARCPVSLESDWSGEQ